MELATWLAFAAAVVSPLAAYIGVRRQRSGRVVTSEAAELWKESSAIRQELYSERNRLNAELSLVRKEHAECEMKIVALRERLARLEEQRG